MKLEQAMEMAETLITDDSQSLSSLGNSADEVAILLFEEIERLNSLIYKMQQTARDSKSDEYEEELIIGKNAATFLVEHMLRLGDSSILISVIVNGVKHKVWCGINTELEAFKKELKEKGTIKEAYLEQQLSAMKQRAEAAEARIKVSNE